MSAHRFSVIAYLVVQTYFVRRPGADPHYEIHFAIDADPKTRPLVLLTNSEALYDQALVLEDTEARVDVAWQAGKRRDGRVAQLLTALRIHREAA
jgi:hypothetical protein